MSEFTFGEIVQMRNQAIQFGTDGGGWEEVVYNSPLNALIQPNLWQSILPAPKQFVLPSLAYQVGSHIFSKFS